MSDFYFTSLEEDEEMVFGVVTSSSTSSHSVHQFDRTVKSSNHSSTRKLGVTNRRVIVETADQPEATRIVPNEEVRRVILKGREFMGKPQFDLTTIETASGQIVEIGIGFLSADDVTRVRSTFPNADIKEDTENN